jgi:hypothetical protein
MWQEYESNINIRGDEDMKYRHTITFVTEIDESHMSGFTLMNWLSMPERERANMIKETTQGIISRQLSIINKNGSWAILKVAE